MPARSLVQALEGLQFPCDRSRLVEYARQREVAPRSLAVLEAIPNRDYHDMTELFAALPSKHEVARRRTVTRLLHEISEEGVEAEEAREAGEGWTGETAQAEALVWFTAPLDTALQLWLCGVQAWPEWVCLSQRLWFPWLPSGEDPHED